ncbi:hypothetical protein W97_02089 [Coniosporium apollinis CBS 100218]|uniref:Cwf18 pre-mRNA splicing factor n=1 Tax=Coniosporium apollinis (strain CBS 100218) TaxID=1168221 RepID=R7YM12_CONA1|nr:uncharacterized protein W97_02089 [Coniosporium apollinis CBS 100218]EON62864.1 hypothetical protein W97_02089 [Coniosporium apollinis CBS 100218]
MSSTHASLTAATQDRKARLAALKSLKRKAPDVELEASEDAAARVSPPPNSTAASAPDATITYLSGRNYDPSTRGPKLGFEAAPSADQPTLEAAAAELAAQTKAAQEAAEREDRPIDLFAIQPKKPNWDLKRDLNRRLEVLNVRTDNAIARLVRERIEAQRVVAKERKRVEGIQEDEEGEGEEVGMEGSTLVEAMRVREAEDEEEERREREEIEEIGDS